MSRRVPQMRRLQVSEEQALFSFGVFASQPFSCFSALPLCVLKARSRFHHNLPY